MNDQPTHGPDTGRQEPTGNDLEVRAKHREEMARIEAERERQMALVDAETIGRMPISLRMLFDRRLNEIVERAATDMAESAGFVPKHLLGKTAACKVVITRSIGWNLDPYAVANSTYELPDGRVGFEGKLYRAIAEASGILRGHLRHEWYGDWDKLPRPSFKIVKNPNGKPVPVPAWEFWGPLEAGLGVMTIGVLAETGEEMSLPFDLVDAYPRNATTWPTRPKLQILNPAVRAFVNNVRSSLLMGVPFRDTVGVEEPPMREINPQAVEPRAPQDAAPPKPMAIRRAKQEQKRREPNDGDHQDGEAQDRQDPQAGRAADQGEDEAQRAQPAGAEGRDGPRGEDPPDTFEFDGVSGSAEDLTRELIRRIRACESEGDVFQVGNDAMGAIADMNAAGYTQQAEAVEEEMREQIDRLRKPESGLPFDQPRRQPGRLSGGLGGKK